MDLKQLQTFLVLNKTKHFTKTAEILGYSQSNVSAQIHQLEDELGGRLFERLGHSIVLSDKGSMLLPLAEKMLALSDEVMKTVSAPEVKSIKMILSESLCTYILPDALAEYRKKEKDTDFYLDLHDDNFYAALQKGYADFAFVLENESNNPYINTLHMAQLEIGLYASPTSQYARSSIKDISEWNNLPLLLTKAGCPYRKQFLEKLQKAGITPQISLETGSIEVLKKMAMAGLGICLLPAIAVKNQMASGELIPVSFPEKIVVRASIIVHKDKRISTYAKELISLLIKKC